MAENFDFRVDADPFVLTADPKWLNAQEKEVAGADMDNVFWGTSSPEKVVVEGDKDLGKITVANPGLFAVGEQAVVSVTGEDGGNIIILEVVLTALAPDTTATHGELTVTPV